MKWYNAFDKLIKLIEEPGELTPEIQNDLKAEVLKIPYMKRKLGKSIVKKMPIPVEVRENPKFVYAMSLV